jgi:superfamily II DNA or RNA helicase
LNDAISDGWLVEPNIIRVPTPTRLDGLAVAESSIGVSDFKRSSLEKRVNTPERNELVVRSYLEHTPGQRIIVFSAGVVHAWEIANTFRSMGVDARMVYGDMPKNERKETLERHRAGEFPVITNCNVLTHGYDDPGLQAVGMAKPTKSKVLYVQSIGRGLRPSPGKESCTILDFVDSSKMHDLACTGEVLGLQRELESTPLCEKGSDG